VSATRGGQISAASAPVAADTEDWVELLTTPGPGRDDALRRLHLLLLRAARHQVSRMGAMTAALGAERADEIANQSADEAMVALLGKLHTFEGRSRFTTWAYKFAVFHTAVEIRRRVWADREVPLHESVEFAASAPSPEEYSEAAALSAAVTDAIETVLTAHQRRVVLALLIDEVPIDVLAERLGTSRNALYKTLHDARQNLRTHLAAGGYLTATSMVQQRSTAPVTTPLGGTR
jgi:RNA polymerase sigma-70 factor, ECF subfamily